MTLDQKNQITAILITKKKAPRETFPWCKQVLTINAIKDSPESRNLVLRQAKTRWVMFLKDSETVSWNLAKEIKSFIRLADQQGYTGAQVIIKKSFLKRNLNHGNWSAKKEVRLGRRVGEWKEKNGQFFWEFPGQKTIFSNPIISRPYNDLAPLLVEINSKTTIGAQEKHRKGQEATLLSIILSPLIVFKKVLFLKLGLLDGLTGFTLAVLEGFQVFLEKSKLWLLKQQEKKVTADN